MKIIQYQDGSADLVFEQNEINTLNDKKRIRLDAMSLRHLGNTLMKIVHEWNLRFPEKIKQEQTTEFSEIKGE